MFYRQLIQSSQLPVLRRGGQRLSTSHYAYCLSRIGTKSLKIVCNSKINGEIINAYHRRDGSIKRGSVMQWLKSHAVVKNNEPDLS